MHAHFKQYCCILSSGSDASGKDNHIAERSRVRTKSLDSSDKYKETQKKSSKKSTTAGKEVFNIHNTKVKPSGSTGAKLKRKMNDKPNSFHIKVDKNSSKDTLKDKETYNLYNINEEMKQKDLLVDCEAIIQDADKVLEEFLTSQGDKSGRLIQLALLFLF